MLKKPVASVSVRKQASFQVTNQLYNQITISKIRSQINSSPYNPSSFRVQFNIRLSQELFPRTARTKLRMHVFLLLCTHLPGPFQLPKFKRTCNPLACRIMNFLLFKLSNTYLETKSAIVMAC